MTAHKSTPQKREILFEIIIRRIKNTLLVGKQNKYNKNIQFVQSPYKFGRAGKKNLFECSVCAFGCFEIHLKIGNTRMQGNTDTST